MGLKEFFLWQLEHEAGTSRKVIERVPEGQNSWKPHDRSMELGYLAALVASMPGWIEFMVNRKELDLSDPANATTDDGEVWAADDAAALNAAAAAAAIRHL